MSRMEYKPHPYYLGLGESQIKKVIKCILKCKCDTICKIVKLLKYSNTSYLFLMECFVSVIERQTIPETHSAVAEGICPGI